MERTQLKHFAIVAGDGKKTGKTTFTRRLIEHFSRQSRLIAIKTSNHFHPLSGEEKILYQSSDFILAEEIKDNLPVDSSRFLKAGASSAFFIMHSDNKLPEAFDKLNYIIGLDRDPVIMESGAALEFIKPGLSVFMTREKSGSLAFDEVLTMEDIADFNFNRFRLNGIEWEIH